MYLLSYFYFEGGSLHYYRNMNLELQSRNRNRLRFFLT